MSDELARLHQPESGQMCANNPPVSGASNGDSKAVEVILERLQNTFLANLFLSNVSITTRAVAKVNDSGLTCDLAVGTTGTDITVQGSANINLTGCGLAANSSSTSSISFGGGNNDVLNASWFQTVGTYNCRRQPADQRPDKTHLFVTGAGSLSMQSADDGLRGADHLLTGCGVAGIN